MRFLGGRCSDLFLLATVRSFDCFSRWLRAFGAFLCFVLFFSRFLSWWAVMFFSSSGPFSPLSFSCFHFLGWRYLFYGAARCVGLGCMVSSSSCCCRGLAFRWASSGWLSLLLRLVLCFFRLCLVVLVLSFSPPCFFWDFTEPVEESLSSSERLSCLWCMSCVFFVFRLLFCRSPGFGFFVRRPRPWMGSFLSGWSASVAFFCMAFCCCTFSCSLVDSPIDRFVTLVASVSIYSLFSPASCRLLFPRSCFSCCFCLCGA